MSVDRLTGCDVMLFSFAPGGKGGADPHPRGWMGMTDCPITASVAVYATLLQPIERHLVLIWPSVWLVTNKP